MTPPVVWTAGMLRASSQTITTTSWAWIASLTGQVLFQPPNVSGWNYAQWLDTSRWAGRLQAVNTALGNNTLNGKKYPFGIEENPSEAYDHAIAFWGGQPLSETGARAPARARPPDRSTARTRPGSRSSSATCARTRCAHLIPMTPDWMTA